MFPGWLRHRESKSLTNLLPCGSFILLSLWMLEYPPL